MTVHTYGDLERLLLMIGADLPRARQAGVDMKSILDPSFRYTKSVDTDLRKTFARIRREQLKSGEARKRADSKVIAMARSRAS
jgi:hypothetical protein